MTLVNVVSETGDLNYNKNIRVNMDNVLFTSVSSMTHNGEKSYRIKLQVSMFEFSLADVDFKAQEFETPELAYTYLDEVAAY